MRGAAIDPGDVMSRDEIACSPLVFHKGSYGQDKPVVAWVSLTIDASRMDITTFEKLALPEVLRVAKLLTSAARTSG
jgi:hypothetical protein